MSAIEETYWKGYWKGHADGKEDALAVLKSEAFAKLVDDVDGEYGWPPWEALKVELRKLGAKVELCDEPINRDGEGT
jgi:FMN phosphatase YigB (HAD superfamily)